MSVYMIVELEVIDPEPYGEYVEKVREVVTGHGGRYLVRGGRVTPLSGSWTPERIIVIEFDSPAALRRCFMSSAYLALAPLGERSARSRAIVVEGCSPDG
ncbi:MAG: DUF1330 domain-containing protein [Phycisphaerae bacterium]|nr:DUF1330 domain-containing protein [Phycisphaerae bacterium]